MLAINVSLTAALFPSFWPLALKAGVTGATRKAHMPYQFRGVGLESLQNMTVSHTFVSRHDCKVRGMSITATGQSKLVMRQPSTNLVTRIKRMTYTNEVFTDKVHM